MGWSASKSTTLSESDVACGSYEQSHSFVQQRRLQKTTCMANHLANAMAVLSAYIWHTWVFFHGKASTSSEQWRLVTTLTRKEEFQLLNRTTWAAEKLLRNAFFELNKVIDRFLFFWDVRNFRLQQELANHKMRQNIMCANWKFQSYQISSLLLQTGTTVIETHKMYVQEESYLFMAIIVNKNELAIHSHGSSWRNHGGMHSCQPSALIHWYTVIVTHFDRYFRHSCPSYSALFDAEYLRNSYYSIMLRSSESIPCFR